jgi:hypothetical protein
MTRRVSGVPVRLVGIGVAVWSLHLLLPYTVCLTCVEYGDGQDVKVAEVPWSCRSIEGFQRQACQEALTFSYISKVQNGPGGLNGDSAGLNPIPLPGGHGVRSLHARGQFGELSSLAILFWSRRVERWKRPCQNGVRRP